MSGLSDLIAGLQKQINQVRDATPRWYTGRVTQVSPLLVDAGGDTDVAPIPAGGWVPILGQPVTCLVVMGRVLAWPKDGATGLASSGTIVAAPGAGATTVQVTVGSSTMALPWLASYTPVALDRVAIGWNPYQWGDGWVAGKLGQAPVPATPPTVPGEALEKVTPVRRASGLAVVAAVDARTWRNGWRGDTLDIVQGVVAGYPANTGHWWYGDRWDQWSGVTVTAVDIYMHRSAGAAGPGGSVQPKFQRHTGSTRGSSKPGLAGATVTGPAYGRGESGWKSLPGLVPVVQALVDSGGGLAIVSGSTADYSRWLSPVAGANPRNPSSGAIRFAWERTT